MPSKTGALVEVAPDNTFNVYDASSATRKKISTRNVKFTNLTTKLDHPKSWYGSQNVSWFAGLTEIDLESWMTHKAGCHIYSKSWFDRD